MKISINGTEYDSWDDVPAELRGALQGALPDANHDGVPDLFQGGPLPTESIVRSSTTIAIGDKTYNSIDEVPEPLRETLRRSGLFAQPGSGQGSAQPIDPGTQPGQPPVSQPVAQPATGQPAYPPQPAQLAYQEPPQVSGGMVTLNGQPYDPNQPEKKRHWWNRKG